LHVVQLIPSLPYRIKIGCFSFLAMAYYDALEFGKDHYTGVYVKNKLQTNYNDV